MKVYRWFYNIFAGTAVCYGLLMMLWLLIFTVFGAPAINFQNVLYLLELVAIPWIINFIFHFNSSVVAKGIIHSVSWFMLAIILFGVNYGIALDLKLLIIIMVAFFTAYALILWAINSLSKKLNTPFRHVGEFIFRLISLIEK